MAIDKEYKGRYLGGKSGKQKTKQQKRGPDSKKNKVLLELYMIQYSWE